LVRAQANSIVGVKEKSKPSMEVKDVPVEEVKGKDKIMKYNVPVEQVKEKRKSSVRVKFGEGKNLAV